MMIAIFSIAFVLLLGFALLRGIMAFFLPGNHPVNIAHRQQCWRQNHPGATRTPWDPPRSSAK